LKYFKPGFKRHVWLDFEKGRKIECFLKYHDLERLGMMLALNRAETKNAARERSRNHVEI